MKKYIDETSQLSSNNEGYHRFMLIKSKALIQTDRLCKLPPTANEGVKSIFVYEDARGVSSHYGQWKAATIHQALRRLECAMIIKEDIHSYCFFKISGTLDFKVIHRADFSSIDMMLDFTVGEWEEAIPSGIMAGVESSGRSAGFKTRLSLRQALGQLSFWRRLTLWDKSTTLELFEKDIANELKNKEHHDHGHERGAGGITRSSPSVC